MLQLRRIRSYALPIVLSGLGAFLLFLFLMPNVEASRREVRLASAYLDVCRIRDACNKSKTSDLSELEKLQTADPWGQPYRIVRLADDTLRVISSGPDQQSPPEAVDDDDIYSDMSASPAVVIQQQKQYELMIAASIAGGFWLLFLGYYLGMRR